MAKGGVFLIGQYQRWLSPIFHGCCRFHPSCSRYTVMAIGKYGFWKGCLLGAWRILRCNPFNAGGVDYP
ncbi:membrane protein insertion efficiency factor YidD [Kolteria novifilia]|uniref:membrane protein insertion efficiency factor YidD n=1 Tax=Kolteria novifilia TaxID=2527975 RepID=UPI003AF3DBB5